MFEIVIIVSQARNLLAYWRLMLRDYCQDSCTDSSNIMVAHRLVIHIQEMEAIAFLLAVKKRMTTANGDTCIRSECFFIRARFHVWAYECMYDCACVRMADELNCSIHGALMLYTESTEFYRNKVSTTSYYNSHFLPLDMKILLKLCFMPQTVTDWKVYQSFVEHIELHWS